MFYFKSDFWEKRDKSLANYVANELASDEIGGQDSLSQEPQTPFAKGAEMNSSMIVLIGIAVMVVVFAIMGFIAMWRERH